MHITIELQPSPQLVQLLEALQPGMHSSCVRAPTHPPPGFRSPSDQPGMHSSCVRAPRATGEQSVLSPPGQPCAKPRVAQENPKHPGPDIYYLKEIEKFAFDKQKFVDLPHIHPALQYYEDGDKLCIRYFSNRIWTTWPNILKLYARFGRFTKRRSFGPLLENADVGNRRSAVSYFLRAINAGLKPGQGSPRELEDPDDDYRPHLKGVIDTSTRYDGGKLEGPLGG